MASRHLLTIIQPGRFSSAPQCAAYLGLIPVEHQSGDSVKGKPRLSTAGNGQIRAKLYMAAVVAIQHNETIKAQYNRLLKNGKCKMSALGAAMRKLTHVCYGVIKHQTEYCPQGS